MVVADFCGHPRHSAPWSSSLLEQDIAPGRLPHAEHSPRCAAAAIAGHIETQIGPVCGLVGSSMKEIQESTTGPMTLSGQALISFCVVPRGNMAKRGAVAFSLRERNPILNLRTPLARDVAW